jgi:hypothetical protein
LASLLTSLLALTIGACNKTTQTLDARPADGHAEGVVPPDFRFGDGGWAGNIGSPCDPKTGAGCAGQAHCLQVGDSVGVCTLRGCRVEDLSTPDMEDDCPPVPSRTDGGLIPTVCTTVSTAARDGGPGSATFCLPKCVPSPNGNSCASINPALACDPLSLLQNGHSEVCMVPACTSDLECGNKDWRHPDQFCETVTGMCHTLGTVNGKVGSPCKKSAECGESQYCYPESKDSSGKVVVEGGYCTIIGCKYGEKSPTPCPPGARCPWRCPSGSKCVVLGAAMAFSLCLATGCQAGVEPKSDGCRDEASAAQYACTAQDGDWVCWLDPLGR